jgi:hypothetical protein
MSRLILNNLMAEALDKINTDLKNDTLRNIMEYEEEANEQLPDDLKGKIRIRVGLLKDQLVAGYQEIS